MIEAHYPASRVPLDLPDLSRKIARDSVSRIEARLIDFDGFS